MLYEKLEKKRVHCYLCNHNCKIPDKEFGICGVRQNQSGNLYTLVYAQPIATAVDPIEKKPLYHFLPGSTSYSIATKGCNFKCGFCQNWQISQANFKNKSEAVNGRMLPGEIVKEAKRLRCRSISYTYTEPTIFFEYAYDSSKIALDSKLYNVFVTNGFMTAQAVLKISPYLAAANVDLKSFSEDFYKNVCRARLAPVLESISLMKKLKIWIEITTLVIPGLNDSDDELKKIAEFIASVGRDIPWHISRFHPDFKFSERVPTPIETLRKAKEIGEAAGLRYCYPGNVFEGNNTYCYNCKATLIERSGLVTTKLLLKDGLCPKCNTAIDGIFT